MHSRRSPLYLLSRAILPCLFLCIAIRPGLCATAQTPVAIPDTPAGKQLTAFLAAFNAGSRATLKAFLENNMETPPNAPGFFDNLTDQDCILYAQSHGLTLRKITQSGDAVVKALTQENATGAWIELTLYITAQPPDYTKAIPPFHIAGMGVTDIETPLEFMPHQKLSEAQIRARVQTMMTALAIFKPAGMAHTDFYELDTDPPNLATGFMDGPHGTRRDNIFNLGVKGSPAEGCYSTGEDMARFHNALIHHTLLNESSRETLWTGVTEQPERNAEYGYGAYIERYNGTRIVWHGGGWQGITNQFDMYPELGYTVVILSNYDDDPGAIANRLREWLTQGVSNEPPHPELPPALALTASLSSSTGTRGTPITITVTVQNSGGTSHASVIDMEVKDASGAKANQQFTMGQKIGAGQTRTYTYSWTPTLAGKYTVDIGAFSPGWSIKRRFESGIATITVN